MTCWPPFSRQRIEASGQSLRFAMAYLRGRYNGGAFTKTVIDATMCTIITLSSFVTSRLRRTK
ncbi:phage holin family protein [Staphylococcus aureus]